MPIGGGALPVAGPAVSSTDNADSSRESLDQLLDALVFAPLGLLLESGKPGAELAARGRRHLEAARLLGRMALGHSPQPPTPPADTERTPNPQPG